MTGKTEDLRDEIREECNICGSMDWQILTDMGAPEPPAARMVCQKCGAVRPYAEDVLPQ